MKYLNANKMIKSSDVFTCDLTNNAMSKQNKSRVINNTEVIFAKIKFNIIIKL